MPILVIVFGFEEEEDEGGADLTDSGLGTAGLSVLGGLAAGESAPGAFEL